jgi:L-proline 4-hydroxylase
VNLTKEQLGRFERDGFLVLPNLLSADEVALLRAELARVSQVVDVRNMREGDGETPHIVYGLPDVGGPTFSSAYYNLARDGRILQPVIDMLEEDVSLFHIKCNFKEAIDGGYWQWHQDYANWKANDAAPQPRLLTAMVMLDHATEMGGCLYFVPGSHTRGIIEPDWDDTSTSYALWTVGKQKMIEITGELGDPVAVTGSPGTVVFFHANMIHGSGHNMSPRHRWQVYLVYNALSNVLGPVPKPRPDYQANRKVERLTVSARRSLTETMAETA